MHFDCTQNPYLCTPTYELTEMRHPEVLEFNPYVVSWLQKNIVNSSYIKETLRTSYLFGKIPFIKSLTTDKSKTFYLFGLIPFMKIKTKKSENCFKLNIFKIPFIKTVEKHILY